MPRLISAESNGRSCAASRSAALSRFVSPRRMPIGRAVLFSRRRQGQGGICDGDTSSTRACPFCSARCFSPKRPGGFAARSPRRFRSLPARLRFAGLQAGTFLRAPLSLARMACRARMIATVDAVADCARISAPTLVVTGERGARSRRLGRRLGRVRVVDSRSAPRRPRADRPSRIHHAASRIRCDRSRVRRRLSRVPVMHVA